jgi:hypothetical protein
MMVTATALAGAIILAHPAWAVLKSTSLLVTDLGQGVPGATITLSKPRPRRVQAKPKPQLQQQQQQQQQATGIDQNGPPPPAGEGPPSGQGQPPKQAGQDGGSGAWIVVKTDPTSRVRLRYDDRDTPPGTVVDITITFINGETLRRKNVPIEQIIHSATLEIEPAGAATDGATSPGDQPPAGQAQQGQPAAGEAEAGQASPPNDAPPEGPPPDSEPDDPSGPSDGGGGMTFGGGSGSGDSHHHH